MNYQHIIQQTQDYVYQQLKNDPTGHDHWHIERVYKLAKYIAQRERADLIVVELAALLHDMDDWKLTGADNTDDLPNAKTWLLQTTLSPELQQQVLQVISTVSFKGLNVTTTSLSLEAQIVQDADRLDAIGAIGIARAFAYGGNANRPLHDPNLKPVAHDNFEAYKKSRSGTINHFYEKLLHLKGRLHTNTAKMIAEERHQFMEDYLQQFYQEWNFDEQQVKL